MLLTAPGELVLPAFIAGFFMFLAPCTLPLIPGFLSFISGSALSDLEKKEVDTIARLKVMLNGFLYVLGFTTIFMGLGMLASFGGQALVQYQTWIARIGGVLVIFFGLYLMDFFTWKRLDFLNNNYSIKTTAFLKPGTPLSSYLFGAIFALGWTPCVGPILASILSLAATSGTVVEGAVLLAVFSAGFALPFLILSAVVGSAITYLRKLNKYVGVIAKVGGLFLFILGILMVFQRVGYINTYLLDFLGFLNYDRILDFL